MAAEKATSHRITVTMIDWSALWTRLLRLDLATDTSTVASAAANIGTAAVPHWAVTVL